MIDELQLSIVNNAEDIKKIIKIFDNVLTPALSERIDDLDKYSLKLYNNAIIVAAEKYKKVVGFYALYANDKKSKTAYLTQIAVLPEYQGSGVGFLLLDDCIKKAKQQGMKRIRLEVMDTNIQAICFYTRNAFIYEGKSDNSNFIYMIKGF